MRITVKCFLTFFILFSLELISKAQTKSYDFDSTLIKNIDLELIMKEPAVFVRNKISPPEVYDIEYSNARMYFGLESGFPDQFCYEICQDKNGLLWIGTDREGVVSFNGNSFTKTSVDDGLSSLHVKKLTIDQKGRVWLGTYEGVDILDNGKVIKTYSHSAHIKERVRDIQEISSDKVLVSYQYSGLYQLELRDSLLEYTKIFSPNSFISDIKLLNNTVYFSCEDRLFEMRRSADHYENPSVIKDFDHPITVIEFIDGVIYVGTDNGVFTFNPITKEVTKILEAKSITFIQELKKTGELLIGTYYDGVLNYNKSSKTYVVLVEQSEVGVPHSLFIDDFGQMWIGTGGKGLIKVYNNTFQKLKINSLETISVKTFENTVFMGTDNGFIILKDEKVYDYSNSLKNNSSIVWDVAYDSKNDRYYMATTGGGICYVQDNYLYSLENLNKVINNMSGTIGITNEYLAIGSYEGLFILKNDTIYGYNCDSEPIEGLYAYNEEVYITTRNFILQYKNGTFKDYSDALKIDYSKEITYCDNNNLFTLGNGLTWLNKKTNKIKYYTDQDGLGSSFLNSIDKQNDSIYWLGTNNGINRIEIINNDSLEIALFDYHDGFMGYGTNSKGILIKDSIIYWGTVNGLIVQNLALSSKKNIHSKIFLTKILVNYNEEIKVPASKKLELDYKTKYLSFNISTVDLVNYDKVKYSFFLEGYSDAWSPWSANEEINFSNLPVDKELILKIKSTNSSGIISDEFTLDIFVKPPFWKTKLFIFIIVLIVIFIIVAFIRFRTKKLIERQTQLEQTVAERTEDLQREKELVEEKHKEITDSINYAERIQRSFLATKQLLDENLIDYFVFFQPKDIVSGDFYWASKFANNQFILVTADSTGHGVPGAIMSIANIACLKESVTKGLSEPAQILNETRRLVIEYLKNDGSQEGGKDGMDASLISLDLANKKMSYAAANNPVWIVRDQEIITCEADKMPVGKHKNQNIPFISKKIDLQKGDVIYTLTDGFPDQFGGEKGKKFMHKKLKELLISIAKNPMEMQKSQLHEIFQSWKGDLEQVDDVCVIGIRI